MAVVDTSVDSIAPRVSWSAVIAGALVAVAIGAMLNLLGVAMGAAALNPFDMSRADAKGLAFAGGLWLALANAVGLFIGAWVAARTGRDWDIRNAGLHSLAVWAVAFVLALLIAGFTGEGFVGTMIHEAMDQPAVAASTIADAAAMPGPGDSNQSPVPVAANAAPAVQVAKTTTAALAGWAFLSMLLGLVAALVAGWLASRGARVGVHPVSHLHDTIHTTERAM